MDATIWQRSFSRVRRNAIAALTLIVILLLGYGFERHKQWFPPLLTLQLKAHAILSKLEARTPRNERVILVEIDDDTFFKELGGTTPTNRKFLADLAQISASADAAAIALDINLTKEPADDKE